MFKDLMYRMLMDTFGQNILRNRERVGRGFKEHNDFLIIYAATISYTTRRLSYHIPPQSSSKSSVKKEEETCAPSLCFAMRSENGELGLGGRKKMGAVVCVAQPQFMQKKCITAQKSPGETNDDENQK
ncbi:hypothetical protein DdX_04513 [Ditylenchus destructor]|uniref:Uncharacterized protein n=1 Tax=Ditylenchus destructor TaxID=166010 RepID=A0AAD4ND73_9BILA|nr:hypothetical protein DdX_04513 [Ditylenchus destructor]